MKERIYVCHTHYHVFVTFLKELNLPREQRGQATLVLSSLFNDFEKIRERIERTGLFEEVVEFDENRDDYFPQLKNGDRVREILLIICGIGSASTKNMLNWRWNLKNCSIGRMNRFNEKSIDLSGK